MLHKGEIALDEFTPEEVGIPRATLMAIKGGTAEQNAHAILQLLSGERGAFRDIVLLNSGAALVVAGVTRNLRDGIGAAAEAIDAGRAMKVLQESRGGR
jgi:anthranilate phosphoribosyltransferase